MTAPFLAAPGLTAPALSPSFPTQAPAPAGDSRCVTARAVSGFSLKLHFSGSQHSLDRSGAPSPFPARSVRVLGNSLSSVVQGQAGCGRAPVCMGSGCGTCGLWQVLVEFLAEMGMARKSAKRRNCQLCVPRGCTVPQGCTVPTECTPRLHWPFWLPPEAAPSPLGALQGCTSPAEHPPGQQGEGAAA